MTRSFGASSVSFVGGGAVLELGINYADQPDRLLSLHYVGPFSHRVNDLYANITPDVYNQDFVEDSVEVALCTDIVLGRQRSPRAFRETRPRDPGAGFLAVQYIMEGVTRNSHAREVIEDALPFGFNDDFDEGRMQQLIQTIAALEPLEEDDGVEDPEPLF